MQACYRLTFIVASFVFLTSSVFKVVCHEYPFAGTEFARKLWGRQTLCDRLCMLLCVSRKHRPDFIFLRFDDVTMFTINRSTIFL